jgi:hypothetical protein
LGRRWIDKVLWKKPADGARSAVRPVKGGPEFLGAPVRPLAEQKLAFRLLDLIRRGVNPAGAVDLIKAEMDRLWPEKE